MRKTCSMPLRSAQVSPGRITPSRKSARMRTVLLQPVRLALVSATVTILSLGQSALAEDAGLTDVVAPGAKVEQLATGFQFVEGPAWDAANQCLYFTDIPPGHILRYQRGVVSVANSESGQANGLMFDARGRLVACEHRGRRVSRVDKTGDPANDVVARFDGRKLNSPNDLWLDQHGGIYFTDPRYGARDDLEQDVEAVYYVDAAGKITRIIHDLVKPNGIALSPDGTMLYVMDNGADKAYRYKVLGPGRIGKGEHIYDVKHPDGMTVDVKGRTYVGAQGGVWVFDADGRRLGVIDTPEQPTNCTFGGHANQTLFITARKSLYAIETKTRGWHVHLDGVPVKGIDELRKARKTLAERRRRIIMNNDGNDARQHDEGEPWTIENFLSKRTSPLVGTHVDTIFYCDGVFNLHTHRSDETEILADEGGQTWVWTKKLHAMGTDPLELTLDFGHARGIEVFWSMRMNDTHDSNPDHRHLLAKWKRDHPGFLMSTEDARPRYGGKRWSAVNYELESVRDKVFRIFEDVCTRYDVDGVELDFFRHPFYFKPQGQGDDVTQQQCDLMSDLLRRIRKMTEEVGLKRGRPILVSARVPDSTGYARAIGLDLERWGRENLVDMLAGSGYFHLEPWESFAALGKELDIPVYAVLSGSRMVSVGSPEGKGEIEQWRGEALHAWESGVDGIYTFNRFNPHDPIFRELGDPDQLRKLEHAYEFNEGNAIDYWLKDGTRFLRRPGQPGGASKTE